MGRRPARKLRLVAVLPVALVLERSSTTSITRVRLARLATSCEPRMPSSVNAKLNQTRSTFSHGRRRGTTGITRCESQSPPMWTICVPAFTLSSCN